MKFLIEQIMYTEFQKIQELFDTSSHNFILVYNILFKIKVISTIRFHTYKYQFI